MPQPFRYPLSLQTVLPEDYPRNREFASLLKLLRELGFRGVELNVADPRKHDFAAIREYLSGFQLEFSMLATGLTARRLGLSLSDPDERARRRAVAICRELIGWVQSPDTGVILGLIKGGPAGDAEAARGRFRRSLGEIVPAARARGVAILVEATNRYETAVARTLAEAAGLVEGYDPGAVQILPDTFHMNIEETDLCEALRAQRSRFRSLHLSDNNRHFPGAGAIDFSRIADCLAEIGYEGRLGIEGNVRDTLAEDLKATMRLLASVFSQPAAAGRAGPGGKRRGVSAGVGGLRRRNL